MRSRKAYPLKVLPSIESEAELVKLPLFEGRQLFVIYPFGFWGNDFSHWAFTEKLKVLERFRKEREKNLKKNFLVGKGVFRFV